MHDLFKAVAVVGGLLVAAGVLMILMAWGWGLVDAAGGRQDLSRTMTAGAVVQVPAEGALQLGNRGEAVVLVDPGGGFIDQVTYTADRVRPGRMVRR